MGNGSDDIVRHLAWVVVPPVVQIEHSRQAKEVVEGGRKGRMPAA